MSGLVILRMARTEKVIMTNMCMVFSENRVLVQDKRDDDYSGITFPGGHVERGESFTDAVIREVWEETGLKISEPKLCGIKDWMKDEETRYIVLFYKTDKFEGIVTSSEEGDVFWLTLDEMKQRKLAYGMDKMLEVFLFNVTVGGLILSVAGMIGLELSENFKKEYKIVKRKSKISKNEKDKRQSNIKIAKNEGIIDIRMSKSGEEVA